MNTGGQEDRRTGGQAAVLLPAVLQAESVLLCLEETAEHGDLHVEGDLGVEEPGVLVALLPELLLEPGHLPGLGLQLRLGGRRLLAHRPAQLPQPLLQLQVLRL